MFDLATEQNRTDRVHQYQKKKKEKKRKVENRTEKDRRRELGTVTRGTGSELRRRQGE